MKILLQLLVGSGVSDVGVVKIENRGKNLIDFKDFQMRYLPFNYTEFNDKVYVYTVYDMFGYFVPVKPNTTYTYKLHYKNCDTRIYEFVEMPDRTQDGFYTTNIAQHPIGFSLTEKTVVGNFTTTNMTRFVWVGIYRASNSNLQLPSILYKDIMLLEGDYTSNMPEYEPPLNNSIEFSTELFGYNGVFDELYGDGTLVKRWQKETGITVTSGAGTLTQSGTGTCILVNETNGEVYEGTVSGTSVSTSAPDGTYTVIYQLATPVISTVSFSGSGLILDKGDNNIILPDYGVMELEYEGTGTSQESLIYMQDLRIREEATYREYQPVNSQYTKSIQTGKKYSISIGQVYFERSMADKLDKDTRFTLEVNKENEDGRTETDRYVNCRLNSVEETDSNGLRMESVDITAEAKEVVA